MTIPKFGKVMPIHGDMLRLIGYRIGRLEATINIPDEERINNMIGGWEELREVTGVDLKYDLSAWREYLLNHKEYGYTHPYAFEGVDSAVQEAIQEKKRAELILQIEAFEQSCTKTPEFELLTPVQEAMLKLIGYRLSSTEATLDIPDDERINNMVMGHKMLCEMTGVDFGFNPLSWQEFLVNTNLSNHYTYAYAFELVAHVVIEMKSDENYLRLASQIGQ